MKGEIEMEHIFEKAQWMHRELPEDMKAMFQPNRRFTTMGFHEHTHNSMDDATTTEAQLITVAVENQAKYAMISDHGVTTGWDDFDDAAQEINKDLPDDKKITPIFALEGYYLGKVIDARGHIILIAKNNEGLKQIQLAMSRGVVVANPRDEENGFTCLTDEALELLRGGNIIATSACIGGIFGSIILHNDKIKNKIDKLMKEIDTFAESMQMYQSTAEAFKDADARLGIAKAELSEAKAAAKKSFAGKQKQLDGMKKKVEKAQAAFDKFLMDGKESSAKSVRVALAQVEVTVDSVDDFQTGIEEAQMKYNQRAAQIRNEMAQTQELANTVDEKNAKMEQAKADRAEAKAKLDVLEKDVAKVDVRKAKIEELEAQKLSKEASVELFESRLNMMLDIFGENFYMEIQYHGLEEEKRIYTWLAAVARKRGIPIVAANDSHMPYKTKDCIIARQIRRSCRFKRWEEMTEDFPEYYMKNDRELAEALYQIFPKDVVVEAMSNVAKIASQCTAVIEKGDHAPKVKNVANVKDEMIRLARANIAKKYGSTWTDKHEDRFNYEVDIIDSMGFNDYFVITWDILNIARKIGGLSYEKLDELKLLMDNMTMDELMAYLNEYDTEPNLSVGLGRGSGAGSIVCYLLGITNIDPFKYDLLFERKKDCVH